MQPENLNCVCLSDLALATTRTVYSSGGNVREVRLISLECLNIDNKTEIILNILVDLTEVQGSVCAVIP